MKSSTYTSIAIKKSTAEKFERLGKKVGAGSRVELIEALSWIIGSLSTTQLTTIKGALKRTRNKNTKVQKPVPLKTTIEPKVKKSKKPTTSTTITQSQQVVFGFTPDQFDTLCKRLKA